MVVMYYGKVRNDDHYNEIRSKYGDNHAQAQVRALRSLGLEANFITNASRKELQRQIDIGRPTLVVGCTKAALPTLPVVVTTRW